jgi:hypothetical protein
MLSENSSWPMLCIHEPCMSYWLDHRWIVVVVTLSWKYKLCAYGAHNVSGYIDWICCITWMVILKWSVMCLLMHFSIVLYVNDTKGKKFISGFQLCSVSAVYVNDTKGKKFISGFQLCSVSAVSYTLMFHQRCVRIPTYACEMISFHWHGSISTTNLLLINVLCCHLQDLELHS